jgi:hypothetical protein
MRFTFKVRDELSKLAYLNRQLYEEANVENGTAPTTSKLSHSSNNGM